ncbi:MAG TPA: hypothetical protein VLB27_07980, partial [candidate division Zixibacteria bacterium]|nr:hypothetical protein [candidate division Zixibacteria bacterium]
MIRSSRILWLSAAACWLIAGAYFLHRYPLTLPAPSEPEKPAVFELRDNGAAVALLVDTAAIAASWRDNNPETADYSLGWVNILEQECGRFDILTASHLTDSALAPRRLVIISRSLQRTLSDTQCDALREFMNNGGVAVIESPAQDICDRLGLAVRVVNSADNDQFKNTNTFQSYTLPGSTTPQDDLVGGALRVGRGAALLTAAKLSWFVTILQQGLPEPAFAVTNRNGRIDEGAKLESNDLAPPDSLINTDSPVADIIERATFNRLAALAPFPRWHTAP